MWKRIVNNLQTHPMGIGVLGILLLVGFAFFQNYQYEKNAIVPYLKTTEMEREKNVSIKTPAEEITYFLQAVKNDDADQVIRSFALGSMAGSTDVESIVGKKKAFSTDLTIAPNVNYSFYHSIALAEITGKYAEDINNFNSDMKVLLDAEVEKIAYVSVDKKTREAYIEWANELKAKEICRMDVYFQNGDDIYKLPFIMVLYNKSWRILEIGKSYEIVEKSELEKELEESEEEKEKRISLEKIRKKTNSVLKTGEGMLSINYSWSNVSYGETPENLLDNFLRCIRLDKVSDALTFGNAGEMPRNVEHTSIEDLISQGKFAERLKYFYYTLLLRWDTDQEKSLVELGVTAKSLVESLEPKYFFYLSLLDMRKLSNEEYLVYWGYEGTYYRFTFCFTEFEEGWQIRDIKDVKIYSYEEYIEEIGEENR